jgi:hypothetical protein
MIGGKKLFIGDKSATGKKTQVKNDSAELFFISSHLGF